ncbi:aspartate/glutamate racemase family protein [Kitasatospora sp. NBC_00240]|uniref:glutamate racemase n=1 Tax=Kitasatospora sp. NBC_00240 TaxID=2903567 RepID=UPI0022563221|nr:aspartate/glutamate racemase family protein [Kitasatospora sp. NBC_00240]MCX5214014.1 aspartate/glutamate racemase family protein [Kitasatospora sp. NBC_00240]
MKIALLDSGIGLLAAAAALRTLRPDVDLVLSSDPDGMPWGPRTPAGVAERALACARAAAAYEPDALVVACNTASVHALEALRADLEPGLPVIGTVPAVKPAVAAGRPVAIWATPLTTGSPYQRGLIRDFAGRTAVTEVACPGLADAVERGDDAAIDAAVAAAAALTPAGTAVIVLGCTHYELVAERIRAAVAPTAAPDLELHGSAGAVAAQALRRIADRDPVRAAQAGNGGLTVLHSGRPADLSPVAARYPEGRLVAAPAQAQAPAPARA